MSHSEEEYARKLTQDWNREIKLTDFLITSARTKHDCTDKIHQGYTLIEKPLCKFGTGSSYKGTYDATGFSGFGKYVYSHGIYIFIKFKTKGLNGLNN